MAATYLFLETENKKNVPSIKKYDILRIMFFRFSHITDIPRFGKHVSDRNVGFIGEQNEFRL